MSRRDARAAGHQARHARARLQAALGDSSAGAPEEGLALDGFQYAAGAEPDGADAGAGSLDGSGVSPALRWRVGLRAAVLLAALAVAAGAWFWWQAGAADPKVLPLGGVSQGNSNAVHGGLAPVEDAGGRSSGPGPGQDTPTQAALVVVHVAGAVANPGVIRLQQGSRINDAIAAAGGARPDADVNRLNLALVVEDGQKIDVPEQGEAVPAAADPSEPGASAAGGSGSSGGAAGAGGGKINLNTADASELDALPKVGPVLAQRIVDWRREHGAFKTVEELDAVDGVGPKMLAALLPLVTV